MKRILWLCLLLIGTGVNAEVVKKSRSGICHDASSSFYERTKTFEAFADIDACLGSGGRLPKGVAKAAIATTGTTNGYARSKFGPGWSDDDNDCQNTRAEVLIAQSVSSLRYANDGCRVTHGQWNSPYTGEKLYDAADVDIDHVIPLYFAWQHGADEWSQKQRERFSNDPANLLAVEASLNRQKGAKGISEWLPPKNQCAYIVRSLRIMKKYRLAIPASTMTQYQQIQNQHCG